MGVSYLMKLNIFFYILLVLIIIQMFYFQIKKLNIKNSLQCLMIFKSNNFLGFLTMISLLIGKI